MPKIQDVQLITFMSVLSGWLCNNKRLCADFRDTFGVALKPVAQIAYRVVGNGPPIVGANSSLPVLGAWRVIDTFRQNTAESRVTSSEIVLKYILPASSDTDTAFAVLHRVLELIDKYLDDMVEDQYAVPPGSPTPGSLLEAAHIIEWAPTWNATYAYEAWDAQTLYPTATARLTMVTERIFDKNDPGDGIQLWDMLGLFIYHNLRGLGSDGATLPTIDPLLSQDLPESATGTTGAPPLYPGTRVSVIR